MAKRVTLATRGGVEIVSVQGLNELRRDLKEASEKTVNRTLTKRLKAAAEIVASSARAKVPTGGSGDAAKSIRAGAGQGGAWVSGGKQEVPYYGWLDFGSRQPITGRPRSMGPWRGSGAGPKGGRFIYPALEDKSAEVLRATRAAVDDALKESNL